MKLIIKKLHRGHSAAPQPKEQKGATNFTNLHELRQQQGIIFPNSCQFVKFVAKWFVV